ncbi:NRDE family protein [Psychrobacter sp. ANT_WB68]|uniref:NRDE family protein n=1 Tax=Psychrobacter sp. ANT_WB68 TaxID=2597355 RepID=UPI0011F1FFEB|nr:NRDE family protein [Psychrobacter sp. ANT_WB68]KAA0913155.1 NRDE family protein [Psychrobacter sp. ANT_WB68]
MCIVAIAWQLFDELPLVLLSNRDEFLQRPTEPLHQWSDKPIYAGRDKQSGGTWLGIHQDQQKGFYKQNGRWAAVLNFRDGMQAGNDERSRGELVTDFLTSSLSPMDFARQISLQDYAGFNLIIGDAAQAVIVNNRGHAPTPLYAGLYVLSNGQPEEAWFKTERLRGRLRQEVLPLISENSDFKYWQDAAFNVLSDSTPAPRDALPETGVPIEIEQALSSIYIAPTYLTNLEKSLPTYGTRTQSILTLSHKSNNPSQSTESQTTHCVRLDSREYQHNMSE